MSYLVTMQQDFKAPHAQHEPHDCSLVIAVRFHERQLGDRGWFFDTRTARRHLEFITAQLERESWNKLFQSQPSFEVVTRWAFHQLRPDIKQLAYVEIINHTLGNTIKYAEDTK